MLFLGNRNDVIGPARQQRLADLWYSKSQWLREAEGWTCQGHTMRAGKASEEGETLTVEVYYLKGLQQNSGKGKEVGAADLFFVSWTLNHRCWWTS